MPTGWPSFTSYHETCCGSDAIFSSPHPSQGTPCGRGSRTLGSDGLWGVEEISPPHSEGKGLVLAPTLVHSMWGSWLQGPPPRPPLPSSSLLSPIVPHYPGPESLVRQLRDKGMCREPGLWAGGSRCEGTTGISTLQLPLGHCPSSPPHRPPHPAHTSLRRQESEQENMCLGVAGGGRASSTGDPCLRDAWVWFSAAHPLLHPPPAPHPAQF